MHTPKIQVLDIILTLYLSAQILQPAYFPPLASLLGFLLLLIIKFLFHGLNTRFAIFTYIQLVLLANVHHKSFNTNKFSAYFLAHGSPMLAIEDNQYTSFLKTLGHEKPKAVIIFTGHWETKVTTISSVQGTYELIYDFYGFPKELYEVKYPAKGSVELAEKVKKVLDNNGIRSEFDEKRGLDHGSWALLSKIFPQADVPIVQISVSPDLSPKYQYELGKALGDLDEDVMVIGSGVTVHNLRKIDWNAKTPTQWAVEFDDWLIDNINKKDHKAVLGYNVMAPHAKDAVPTTEHFVPLLIAMGSADQTKEPEVLYRAYDFGTLSYLCFRFA